MTTATITLHTARPNTARPTATELDEAAVALHRAETALHIARQTGVDEWIKAAGDRLHEAVVRYEAVRAQS